MANQLENFDQLLKDAYEGHDVPVNDLHWEELEEELNFVTPGITGYYSAVTTGILATSLVFMAMLFFISDAEYGPHQEEVVEETTEGNGTGFGTENSATTTTFDATSNSNENSGIADNQTNTETNDSEKSEIENESNSDTESSIDTNTESTITSAENNEAKTDKSSDTNTAVTKKESTKAPKNKTIVASSVENEKPSNVRTGCTGLTIEFDASSEYGANAKYLWNFGDGYFSTDAKPSHTFNKEGTFDVSLSVTSAASGQITSNVVQAMIDVVEAPVANLDITIEGPTAISLNNKSYNASDVEWNIDGSTHGNGSSISLSIADNTSYDLRLAALNDGGCVDTLITEIKAVEAGSEFPKAIDTAYGTAFAPGTILNEGEVTSIKIYNRNSGDLVFEGSGNKGWTGTSSSGEKADKGMYRWIMAVEREASIDIYHGDLELR